MRRIAPVSLSLVAALWLNIAQAANLTVTFLDCGQGDAAVVQTPGGKTYLVDAGPNDRMYGGRVDAGTDVVVPFLRKRGVKSLDGVILSHPHLDHYGGLFAVLESFSVSTFWDPGWPTSAKPYLRLLETIERKKIPYRTLKEGDPPLNWDPAITAEVLGPRPKPFADNQENEKTNNRSIVLRIAYGDVAILFTGDAERQAELHMAEALSGGLKAQVLKAGHHGSRTSCTEDFLKAVDPELAIISCGRKNPYGHPHPGVLKRLKRLGIKTLRTDKDGSIEITTDGKNYTVRLVGK